MENDEVKEGLMVITTELLNDDPDYFKGNVDARRPGKVGEVSRQVMIGDKKAWLINHNRGDDIAVYMSGEFEPYLREDKVQMETYISSGFISNECIMCKESPTVATVSFFLSFYLGTHILVHFCEKHMNHVDVLKGVSKALAKVAGDIEMGVTWKEKISKEKSYGLIAIRPIDYDQFGCPHCCYQLPSVEFAPDSVVYVLCEKCNLPYVVFADGVTKKSTMVEVPNENKVRATLQDHPKRGSSKYGLSPYKRIFRCGNENCQKLYPSDRHETKCDVCGDKVKLILVPNKKPDAVSD
jgi:hypothetical protein